ncbi:MAG: M28 family peptidase [Clostridia bacterium]|nr:M28 family peptidase [Clostridia bacterium]
MNKQNLMQFICDNAYIRTGGSPEERACADAIIAQCAAIGLTAHREPFTVDMATIRTARLEADGRTVPCLGYLCAGSHTVDAPLYYLRSSDPASLAACRGKIVLLDGALNHATYQNLLRHGALGFISCNGDVHRPDEAIDQRELRRIVVGDGEKLPGVNIHAKSALALVSGGAKTAKIILEQEEYTGESQNVLLELPGESPETILFTAHYDSTALSQGAYDNLSGCAVMLHLIDRFRTHPHRRTLRFLFCGSEERFLLGSQAHVQMHADTLAQIVLDINLDMLGCIMGAFGARCCAEPSVVSYIEFFAAELGVSIPSRQGVHSSDSAPFADRGIPTVSFACGAPANFATIHTIHDTPAVLSGDQLLADAEVVFAFADRMANAVNFPIPRTVPDNMRRELDKYFCRTN